MSYYSDDEVASLGFKRTGKNVRISRKASIYNPQKIEIDDFSRIDDFCVLSAGEGGIYIGRHVHVGVYASVLGAGKIALLDFCNISSRVSIYSSNDDYSGEWMTNPTVPSKYTNVHHADVEIGRHCIIGSGSVVLPGVVIEDGVAIGALSLVKDNCKSFGIYAGVPARRISDRKRKVINLEKAFLSNQ